MCRRLFSFYQIATKVGATYLVTFPSSVEQSLDAFSWINLELDGLGLPLACIGLGSFEAKLTFLMLSPLAVLLITKVISWFRREREHERKVMRTEMESRVSHARRRAAVAITQSTYKFLPTALRVSFLAFPTVSSMASAAARIRSALTTDTPRFPSLWLSPKASPNAGLRFAPSSRILLLPRLRRPSRPFAAWTST